LDELVAVAEDANRAQDSCPVGAVRTVRLSAAGRGTIAYVTNPTVESVPIGVEERWLLDLQYAPSDLPGFRVDRLLPAGYERYLRVFHPFLPWDTDAAGFSADRTPTWRSLAMDAGVTFHSEIMWENLRPVLGGREGPRPYYVTQGNLDEPARTRLFVLLADASGDKPTLFYYGLAAMICGAGALLYRAPFRAIGAAENRAAADVQLLPTNRQHLYGPEYVWPVDRSWVLTTDYDLVSTYIACDRALADRLLADDVLEVLPVELTTRINGSD
jgi:hypothetical protein